MLIYEDGNNFTEGLKKRCKELKETIPEVYWPDWVNFNNGEITGYCNGFFSAKAISVYYNHKIAVISNKLENNSEIAKKLQKIGYFVPSKMMLISNSNREVISPISILWDELRKGEGISKIKNNLEGLLRPLLTSIKGVENFEFSIYNPYLVTSTDDVIPPYIEYDELFQLPTFGNGMVNLDVLLEKIKTMPPDRALAISSKTKIKNEVQHIPMIDFISSDGALEKEDVISVTNRLDIPQKIIVDSGNSFHHHNTKQLLSDEGFRNYLEKIAEQPEVGKNWPYFSAYQGFSLLRISPSSTKPNYPIIVSEDD